MNRYKKCVICFVVIPIILSNYQNVFSQNKSALYIDLLTSNPPNSSIVITDPLGRRTGVKKFINGSRDIDIGFEEIPSSYKAYEGSPANDVTGEPSITGRLMIGITQDVLPGTYHMTIYSSSSTVYKVNIRQRDLTGKSGNFLNLKGFINVNTTAQYDIPFDPTPGAPPPTITKIVTFQTLRDDFNVAQKLNQIGDDKFVNSLIKMVDIAEKLYNRCENIKDKEKDENKQDKHKRLCYRPVIAILELIKKRLEIVNRICDNPNGCKSKCKLKDECDEEKAFDNFRKENIKEEGIKEFFSEWDKDEWHKHKKMCKRFVTDEALKIISEDIDWLIKSFSVEKDKLKDKLDKDDIKDLKSEK